MLHSSISKAEYRGGGLLHPSQSIICKADPYTNRRSLRGLRLHWSSSGLCGPDRAGLSVNADVNTRPPWMSALRRRVGVRAAGGQESRSVTAVREGRGRGGNRRKITAIVTIKRKPAPNLIEKGLQDVDARFDWMGMKVVLQLVSREADSGGISGKRSGESVLRGWAEKAGYVADKVKYTAEFEVGPDFGLPGAITVRNGHPYEFYLETIALEGGWPTGRVYFPCYSWVHSTLDDPSRRVFFSNHAFLPDETPPGLRQLREKEKSLARGEGPDGRSRGTRRPHERIYDYALYNDLGNPDARRSLLRPAFGASPDLPYPRRLRTGRPPTKTDRRLESVVGRGVNYYVPRDETFEDLKQECYVAGTIKLFVHELLPELERRWSKACEFSCFTDIDHLYKDGTILQDFDIVTRTLNFFSNLGLDRVGLLPRFFKRMENSISLQYTKPQLLLKDRFSWLRDDELGRQVLAGTNPLQIELLKSFPPVSNLDPSIYGAKESTIRKEHLERQLEGLTVEEAIEHKRLFIMDYHDAFMPFVQKVNALKDRKMYASRTIFFLNASGTLSPLAIELSLPPPSPGLPGRQRVFTPGQDATTRWLWKLAKMHATCNNAGFHQVVNHWLRSHAVVEPYVIATHRRLSFMHPIAKLLHPHLRYTLEINALARQLLINADGVVENCFTPGPHCMEISSAAYKALWRFDQESLPADLLKRGMAVEDPNSPSGLKLVIEDYPYAADGLLIWGAIKDWVNEYVFLYYSDCKGVAEDVELQEWWQEIREQGHGDKKDEPWWPKLETREDLVGILSTMIWVTSAHHAAVNFGQYMYGGYVPNHPCLTRKLIPDPEEDEEGREEYEEFLENPQKFFLSALPNRYQSTYVMSVLDSLSTHAPDEEYLGQRVQANWTADGRAKDAASRFARRIAEVERMIDARNRDARLKNRTGAGVLPYELLRPTSHPGVTGRGVPNSISI